MTEHGVNVALNTSFFNFFFFIIVLKIVKGTISDCQVVVVEL